MPPGGAALPAPDREAPGHAPACATPGLAAPKRVTPKRAARHHADRHRADWHHADWHYADRHRAAQHLAPPHFAPLPFVPERGPAPYFVPPGRAAPGWTVPGCEAPHPRACPPGPPRASRRTRPAWSGAEGAAWRQLSTSAATPQQPPAPPQHQTCSHPRIASWSQHPGNAPAVLACSQPPRGRAPPARPALPPAPRANARRVRLGGPHAAGQRVSGWVDALQPGRRTQRAGLPAKGLHAKRRARPLHPRTRHAARSPWFRRDPPSPMPPPHRALHARAAGPPESAIP